MLSMYMWTHIHKIKKVDNRRIKKVNMLIQVQTYFETSQNMYIFQGGISRKIFTFSASCF